MREREREGERLWSTVKEWEERECRLGEKTRKEGVTEKKRIRKREEEWEEKRGGGVRRGSKIN